MKRSFRYRLYPTKKQQRLLNEWLELCCDVYHAALDERKSAYRVAGVSIDYTQQCAELHGCKVVRPELAHVNSQVLQDVLKRVDLAFASFFRRMAQGQKAGYPRFRSRRRYNSLTFKQYGNSFSFSAQGKLVLSKAKKGTPERAKRRKVVARVHERIRFRRENFINQQVARLIARFGLIAVEALVVRSMVQNPKLAQSIADAAWSAFFAQLVLKAEEAARQVVKVTPAYTSQTCSGCGHRQELPLSVRFYECSNCSLRRDRDHNASLNILAQAVGRHGCVIRRAPPAREPWGVVTKRSSNE